MCVPFENLHVFHRVGVQTDIEWSYQKVVEQRRGGWCFELNGCFAELLRRLGFRVDLLSCRTFDAVTGGLSPDFDHLTLLVHVDGAPYLADVGWGDSPLEPLPAEPGEYPSRPRPARIETDASTLRLFERIERPTARPDGSRSIRRRASRASSPSSNPAAVSCRPNQDCRGRRSRS